MSKFLKPFKIPAKETLKTLSVEEATAIDAENKETWKANRRLFDAAKRVAEELDPTNRNIRALDYPPPPADITALVIKLKEQEQAAKEAAARG